MDLNITRIYTGPYTCLPDAYKEYFENPKINAYIFGVDAIGNHREDAYYALRDDFLNHEDIPNEVKSLDIDQALELCLGSYDTLSSKFLATPDMYRDYEEDEDDPDTWIRAWFHVEWV